MPRTLLGTDPLSDVAAGLGLRGRGTDLLVDVILSGADPDRIREDLRGILGTDLLRGGLPEVELLLAEAARRSPEEIEFEKRVRAAERRVQRYSADLRKQVDSALAAFRREVNGIVAGTEWDQYRLDTVKRELEAAHGRLLGSFNAQIKERATEASALALMNIDDPVRALLGGGPLPVARIPFDQIALIQNLTPDLIRYQTADAVKRVQTALTGHVLGALNAKQARQRIGQIVGNLPGRGGRELLPGKIFTDLQLRTETIMRTEMNRVYNLTATARIDDVAATIPGVGKRWVHQRTASRSPRANHAALDGTIVFPGEKEKFTLIGKSGTYKIDGPHDPALPAEESINCHCRVRVAYSQEVAEEQKRRGGFEKTPTGPAPSKKVAKKKAPAKKAPKPAAPAPAPAPGGVPAPPGPGASRKAHLEYQKKLLELDLDEYPKTGSSLQPWANRFSSFDSKFIGKSDNGIRSVLNHKGKKMFGELVDDDLIDEALADMSQILHDMAVESRRRGIPGLRAVRYSNGKAYTAAMGDGILYVDAESFVLSAARKRAYLRDPRAFDLAENRETLARFEQNLAFHQGKGNAALTAQAQELVDDARDRIERIEAWDYDAGLPTFRVGTPSYKGNGVTSSYYRPGPNAKSNMVGAPSVSGYYVRSDQYWRTVVEHEYAHHIHQQTGGFYKTKQYFSYINPPIESELEKLPVTFWRIPPGLNPTDYSCSNVKEWFAENYALYRMGYADTLNPNFLGLLNKLGLM